MITGATAYEPAAAAKSCPQQARRPCFNLLSALAAFFGVSPMYFFQQAEADRDAVPPELIAALRNDEVRDMALRTIGLSDRALRAIKDMIENARAVEGLATKDSGT